VKTLLINILTFVVEKLVKLSPPAVSNNVKLAVLCKLDTYNNSFNSIISRPKLSEQIQQNGFFESRAKVGIVLQGPVVLEEDFTLETIKIYKKNYSNHILILCTWEGLDANFENEVAQLGVEIIKSKQPTERGALNVNLQIVSSSNGIKRAKELGCQYVYKTRTDQRIYATDLSDFLIEKVHKDSSDLPAVMKGRLVSSSLTTVYLRPFGIGDMFMFGTIEDMLLYWDSKLDNRTFVKETVPSLSVLETAKLKLAETYLCTNFLDKIEYEYQMTLTDSLEVYRKLFYVVDFLSINQFWYKYDWRNESRFDYYQPNTFHLLNSINFEQLSNEENKRIGTIYDLSKLNEGGLI